MKVLTEKEFIAEVERLNRHLVYMIEHDIKIDKTVPAHKILAQSHLLEVLSIMVKSK